MNLSALLHPGHVLTEAEAAALAEALLPPWQARRRALEARDAAVVAALAATGQPSPTVACCDLERAMRRRAGRGTVHPRALSDAADAVLAANGGRPIGWQHLGRIEREQRRNDADTMCKISDGDAQDARGIESP